MVQNKMFKNYVVYENRILDARNLVRSSYGGPPKDRRTEQTKKAMATEGRIDEEFLCCALCCRSLHVPKILPCLHIFCRKCLRTYVEKSKVQGHSSTARHHGNTQAADGAGGTQIHRDSGYSGSGDSNLKPPHATSSCGQGSQDDLTDASQLYMTASHALPDEEHRSASDHEDSHYEIPMAYGDRSELDPLKLKDSLARKKQADMRAKLEKTDTIYENDGDDQNDNYITAACLTPEVKKRITYAAKSVTVPHPTPRKTIEHKASVSSLDVEIPAEDLMRKPSIQYMTPDKTVPVTDTQPGEYINLEEEKKEGPTSHYVNADQARNSRATYKHWTIRNSQNYEDIDANLEQTDGLKEVFYDTPKLIGVQHKVIDGYLPLDSQHMGSLPRTPAPPPPATQGHVQSHAQGQGQGNKAPRPPMMKIRQKSPAPCNGDVKGEGTKHSKHKKGKGKMKAKSGLPSPKTPVSPPAVAAGMELYEEAAEVLYPGDVTMYFPCPVCETMIQVPEAGVEEFKTCTLVKTMQDRFHIQKKEKFNCDHCESKVAKFRCFECKQYLCNGCRDAHGWRMATRKHKMMALSDTHSAKTQRDTMTPAGPAHCNLHRRRPATHLCATCDHIICADCQVAEDHQGHVCAHIETCVPRQRQFIQALTSSASTLQGKMDHGQEELKAYSKSCLSDKKALLEQLEKAKKDILATVEQAYDELCKEVEADYAIEKRKVDAMKKDIANAHKQLGQGLVFSDNLLKYGQDGDVCSMSATVIRSLKKLKDSGTPELQSKLDVSFKAANLTTADVKPLFGRLHAKQKSTKPEPSRPLHLTSAEQDQSPILSFTFKAKTFKDLRGCKPTGVSMLPNDTLVIVDDINKKMKQFDQQGHLLWECCPVGAHQLVDPWDIVCTRDQHLAVTDRGSKSIKVFTRNGDFVREFGSPELQSAWGIAENSKGDIVVTDAYQRCVVVYSNTGHRLFSLPNKASADQNIFECPEYVAINHNDDIIISDIKKHCIFVFDCLGRHLFTYGSKGNGVQNFDVPCGVCVDKQGNILVADYTNQRIAKLTSDGEFVGHLATRKDGLILPQTLVFSKDDHLIVLDRTDVKVFRFTELEKPIFREMPPNIGDLSPLNFTEEEEVIYDTPSGAPNVPQVPLLSQSSTSVETTV